MTKKRLDELRAELQALANPAKAKVLSGFFKTGKGQYGEGDVFLGITVPAQRAITKRFLDLSLGDIHELLHGKIHEHRVTGVMILVQQYEKRPGEREGIVEFYLRRATCINNWDLVDGSAPYILGDWLIKEDRAILHKLAKSKNLWERRIAIVATYALIKNGEFKDTLLIATALLDDDHDLIHKAVGWMLREVGKRDERVLKSYLEKHLKRMPRTSLRYAIERFDKKTRDEYLRR